MTMASIAIRNLDDDVKTRLRVRAGDNGRTMEEEANGVDLELPPREHGRESPFFD